MEIICETKNFKTILTISGRIDVTTSADFEKQVLSKLAEANEIFLDCSGIEYISSAGLRSMLIIAKNADTQNKKVILCRISKLCHEVLEVSGFDAFFEVRNDIDS